MANAVTAAGGQVGIYASASMWSTIAGSSCTFASSYPLWWPHYDKSPSFGNFAAFGGWTAP